MVLFSCDTGKGDYAQELSRLMPKVTVIAPSGVIRDENKIQREVTMDMNAPVVKGVVNSDGTDGT